MLKALNTKELIKLLKKYKVSEIGFNEGGWIMLENEKVYAVDLDAINTLIRAVKKMIDGEILADDFEVFHMKFKEPKNLFRAFIEQLVEEKLNTGWKARR